MAKRKTPKSKKVVDLKPKLEKLEEAELTQIQSLVRHNNEITLEIGRLEAQKHQLLHRISASNEEIKAVQQQLEAKYGDVDVDLRDGKLTYKENGQVNS